MGLLHPRGLSNFRTRQKNQTADDRRSRFSILFIESLRGFYATYLWRGEKGRNETAPDYSE